MEKWAINHVPRAVRGTLHLKRRAAAAAGFKSLPHFKMKKKKARQKEIMKQAHRENARDRQRVFGPCHCYMESAAHLFMIDARA